MYYYSYKPSMLILGTAVETLNLFFMPTLNPEYNRKTNHLLSPNDCEKKYLQIALNPRKVPGLLPYKPFCSSVMTFPALVGIVCVTLPSIVVSAKDSFSLKRISEVRRVVSVRMMYVPGKSFFHSYVKRYVL